MRPPTEAFARTLSEATVKAVRGASSAKTLSRRLVLAEVFEDPDGARAQAAAIKGHVLDHLGGYLREFERNAQAAGIHVHWAKDAASARSIIRELCGAATTIVKGKSMATEEIHLNPELIAAGHDVIETDLGEYVVQIDDDTPSHIVTPIIHKDRYEVARSFEREQLGPYTEDPAELAQQARRKLRSKFQSATIGISGVNFAIASEGALVLVENEGNNRLSTTAPNTHIAVMGLEKLLPDFSSLPLFLRLLAASATGQRLTVYTHIIRGPRRSDEEDGPQTVHVVILDNGRSELLRGKYRDILKCIRCGACLNVCPVYRQISGHGYRHTYSGPLGAVLAPGLEGLHAMGDLAKASTLCGACEEVCPVQIPIPDMLLHLRDDGVRTGAVENPIPWNAFAAGATSSGRWRAGLTFLPLASGLPNPISTAWKEFKELPEPDGTDFRKWWRNRTS